MRRYVSTGAGVLASAMAGAALVAAFAPLSWSVLAPFSLAVPFALSRRVKPVHAAAIGYAFGLGLFGAGVAWIHIAVETVGGPAWLAWLAAAGLAVFLSAYPALALGGAIAWSRSSRPVCCSFSCVRSGERKTFRCSINHDVAPIGCSAASACHRKCHELPEAGRGLVSILYNGLAGSSMPAWRTLNEQQIADIAAYVQTLHVSRSEPAPHDRARAPGAAIQGPSNSCLMSMNTATPTIATAKTTCNVRPAR